LTTRSERRRLRRYRAAARAGAVADGGRVGCLYQLSGWWCGVGGRSGPGLLLLLGRRLLVSASVTDSAAGSGHGHLDAACSRSPGAALMAALIALEKLAFVTHLAHLTRAQ